MRRRGVPIADMLRGALPPHVRDRVYTEELLAKSWVDVVGLELARRSEPEGLNPGVLTVRVTDPAWGKMIRGLQFQILPRVNKILGGRMVRRLNFITRQELRFPPPAEPVAEDVEEPTPSDALVSAASDIEDPELRALVLRSAARYLKNQSTRSRR